MAGTEPLYVVKSYGGACQATDLAVNMGPTDLSFTLVTEPTSWIESHGANAGQPLGTSGPFCVTVDKGVASGDSTIEEKILCSSYSGAVVTVFESGSGDTLWTGRGYDGTTAQAHTAPGVASGLVLPSWPSEDSWEANQAVSELLGASTAGYVWMNNGTTGSWQVPLADSGWIVPTFTNSWVDAIGVGLTVAYRKQGNVVRLRGPVTGGASASSIFTLPSGYRPTVSLTFPTANFYTSTGTPVELAVIESTGYIVPTYEGSHATVLLDGITWTTD